MDDVFSNGVTPRQVASAISNRRLELTILPTEKCNFRCTYCYEDFEIGRMPSALQSGLIKLVEARASELEELQLNWFGGEPLLAKSVIFNIAERAFELSRRHAFALQGGLTTNAYLLDLETLERLVALNQNFFQITLDGWAEGHDSTRRLANGRGTFERIWSNLIAAHKSSLEFRIVMRLHITNDNHASMARLCAAINSEILGDDRFSWDFQDVRDLGGSGGASVDKVEPIDFAAVTALLNGIIQGTKQADDPVDMQCASEANVVKKSESSSGRQLYMLDEAEPYICYASKPNHLLIRADGRVGKCTVALNDDINTIGSLGKDGRILIDQDKARAWSNGFVDFNIEALGCPLSRIHSFSRSKQKEVPQRDDVGSRSIELEMV
ncbi:radical SAM protein [Luteimonas fraxinea]|uniref:radical SAM protein n=1 Tax=Luteimonas fraxinea TaxID=2901869 RepID=UPI001E59DAD7|nr:radical SAM protein [Luteimonas fraxinea]MCD9126005.1 radical SAM protein [Luteimonas fraxinea]